MSGRHTEPGRMNQMAGLQSTVIVTEIQPHQGQFGVKHPHPTRPQTSAKQRYAFVTLIEYLSYLGCKCSCYSL